MTALEQINVNIALHSVRPIIIAKCQLRYHGDGNLASFIFITTNVIRIIYIVVVIFTVGTLSVPLSFNPRLYFIQQSFIALTSAIHQPNVGPMLGQRRRGLIIGM